jgi:SAM-dependent methyltransferase
MNGIQLREVFDTVAALYDRARPRYPSALFDDLAELTGIRSGARVLEIGPGTGQATLTLATRGYSITAVELGRHLAAHARDKMASFAGVQIENADFETWPLPAEPFDLVFAATAFHWIGREVGERKSAGALREGGALAVVTTTHVADNDEDFWIGIQGCYERHVPGTKPGRRLPRIDGVRDVCDEIGVTGWFESPVLRQYSCDTSYTTEQYLDLLHTHSNHIALEPDVRASLLDAVRTLVEARPSGRVTVRYLFRLAIARKRASHSHAAERTEVARHLRHD